MQSQTFLSPYPRARSLQKEVVFMEKISEDCFLENAYLRELYEQSVYTKTTVGKLLHSLGYLLSVFAFLRFFSGLFAVAGYMWRFYFYFGSQMPEEAYDGVVSSVLRFLVENLGLPLDVSFWSPLLSFLLVSSLAMMQIRGFLDSTRQISQLSGGVSIVPAELYSLLLAHVSGSYFMACVVLLRVHLPLRFRIGVTAVLGEDRDFGFYVWWYVTIAILLFSQCP